MTTAEDILAEVEQKANEDNDLVLIRVIEYVQRQFLYEKCERCWEKLDYVKSKLWLHRAKRRYNNHCLEGWSEIAYKSSTDMIRHVAKLRGETAELRAAYRSKLCNCNGKTWNLIGDRFMRGCKKRPLHVPQPSSADLFSRELNSMTDHRSLGAAHGGRWTNGI